MLFAQDSPGDLIAAGQYAQALKTIKIALRSNPKDVRLWIAEGLAYRGLGRHQQSLASFQQALARTPTLMPALEGAAEAAFAVHDPSATNPTALAQLMLALRRLGRTEEASAAATRLSDLLASQRKEEIERNRIHVFKSDAGGDK